MLGNVFATTTFFGSVVATTMVRACVAGRCRTAMALGGRVESVGRVHHSGQRLKLCSSLCGHVANSAVVLELFDAFEGNEGVEGIQGSMPVSGVFEHQQPGDKV